LGLAHLFVKVHRPRDSEVTFSVLLPPIGVGSREWPKNSKKNTEK